MLRHLKPSNDDRLLVDASTGDDAAVWRLDDGRALVVTADFITPLVDDARTWGRIAAANAVSDVYAMGGRPLLALNLVAWNRDELPLDLLADVLEGCSDIAEAGGFVIAGGHTIDDPIPKVGLAVVGEADPDHLLTNSGFRPGQNLILTKPLGIGIVSTAVKSGEPLVAGSPESGEPSILNQAIASMTRLNNDAAAAALAAGATGATDITGFGLLGHLGRAARESEVELDLVVDSVPMLPGVRELAESGFVPGGTRRNLAAVKDQLVLNPQRETTEVETLMLADAQTSGGLVFGCDGQRTDEALERLRSQGHEAAVIGTVLATGSVATNRPGTIRLS